MNILESTFWISSVRCDFRLIFQPRTLIPIYPVVTYSPIDMEKTKCSFKEDEYIYRISIFTKYIQKESLVHQFRRRGKESVKHCQDLLCKHTISVGDKEVLCLCPAVSADASLSPIVINHIVVTICHKYHK